MMWCLQIKQIVRKSCTHGTIQAKILWVPPTACWLSTSEAPFLKLLLCTQLSICFLLYDVQGRAGEESPICIVPGPGVCDVDNQTLNTTCSHYVTSYQQNKSISVQHQTKDVMFLGHCTVLYFNTQFTAPSNKRRSCDGVLIRIINSKAEFGGTN